MKIRILQNAPVGYHIGQIVEAIQNPMMPECVVTLTKSATLWYLHMGQWESIDPNEMIQIKTDGLDKPSYIEVTKSLAALLGGDPVSITITWQ